jgi:hypothetical protein
MTFGSFIASDRMRRRRIPPTPHRNPSPLTTAHEGVVRHHAAAGSMMSSLQRLRDRTATCARGVFAAGRRSEGRRRRRATSRGRVRRAVARLLTHANTREGEVRRVPTPRLASWGGTSRSEVGPSRGEAVRGRCRGWQQPARASHPDGPRPRGGRPVRRTGRSLCKR